MDTLTARRGRLRHWVAAQPRPVRWVIWLALAGLALVVVALGVAIYGWRYGFTPLPQPVPGIVLPEPSRLTWDQVTPSNGWYWVREMERSLAQEPGGGEAPLLAMAKEWNQYGPIAITNAPEVEAWLEAHPQMDRWFQEALRAPETEHPRIQLVPGSDWADVHAELRGVTQLHAYGLWRVALCEDQGQSSEAFERLLALWRLQLRYWSANGGYWVQIDCAGMGRAIRRLALDGDPIPLPALRSVLRELGQLADGLGSLEAAVIWNRHLSAALNRNRLLYCRQRSLANELSVFLPAIGQRRAMIGRNSGVSSHPDDIAEGLGGLQAVSASRLIRLQDFEAVEQACFSQSIAFIRAGKLEDAIDYESRTAVEASLRFQRHWDRPWAWMAAAFNPGWPARCQSRQRFWLLSQRSAQLTVALCAYKLMHGNWPDRSEQLVPDILDQVPLDPFSDQPFQYQRKGDTWEFSTVDVDPDGGRPLTPSELRARIKNGQFRYVFRSTEPPDDERRWKAGGLDIGGMDPRVLKRYFPELFEKLQRAQTNAGTSTPPVVPSPSSTSNP